MSSMLYDEITSEEFAEIRANEAAEEAFKSGLAEGEAKGRQSGLAEGEAKGEAKAKQQTALSMLNKGLDILLISEVTGMPIDELKSLNIKK